MRNLALLVIVLLGAPAVSQASPIHYTFTGAGGLSGGFVLDDEAIFNITVFPWVDGPATYAELGTSPLHALWGSYGGYTFNGTPELEIFDAADSSYDFWIVRTPLVSVPFGEPLSPTHLNLFVYVGMSGISLIPPTAPNLQPHNLQFTLDYANSGTFIGGPLTTLRVPEPSTLLLGVVGLSALLIRRRPHGATRSGCG